VAGILVVKGTPGSSWNVALYIWYKCTNVSEESNVSIFYETTGITPKKRALFSATAL
jgi:hypothetical protein